MIGIIKSISRKIKNSFLNSFPTLSLNASAMHKDRGEIFYKSYQNQEKELLSRIDGTDLHKLLLSKLGDNVSISELIEWYFLKSKNIQTPKTLRAQMLFSQPIEIDKVEPGDILEPKLNTSHISIPKKNEKQKFKYINPNPVIYVGSDKFNNDLGITISDTTKTVILTEVDLREFYARRYQNN